MVVQLRFVFLGVQLVMLKCQLQHQILVVWFGGVAREAECALKNRNRKALTFVVLRQISDYLSN